MYIMTLRCHFKLVSSHFLAYQQQNKAYGTHNFSFRLNISQFFLYNKKNQVKNTRK